METYRIGRMILKGELMGSASLSENAEGTLVSLSVRGNAAGAVLYTAGEGGVRRTELSDPRRALVLQRGITVIALSRGGRIISRGSAGRGMDRRETSRLMDEISIRAASEEAMPAKPAPEPKRAETQAAKPQGEKQPPARPPERRNMAEVTNRILEQAEWLFGMLDGMRGGTEPPPAAEPAEQKEEQTACAIRNPFPRTFPDSVWKTRGGEVLSGRQLKNGRLTELVAVPVTRGSVKPRPAAGFTPLPRPVMAGDGRRYWLFEQTSERKEGASDPGRG
ncbi:MAG: hypothetical protein K6G56_04210 [Clostridiales bacterium]|nr:hypothetical protein [Clostridiales bacterium]